MLEVQDLCVQYGSCRILDNVGFQAKPGQWLMVIGPNGAGKSTLLQAIMQSCPYRGSIRFCGKELRRIKPVQRATLLGILEQNHYVGYDFSVEEVVRLGRYARSAGLLHGKCDDPAAVERALMQTGMEEKRDQSVLTLSGGELQRTFLAQLLAQDPTLLLLDEPTNHLDPVQQKEVFTLVSAWLKQPGRAVISVVHDLSLAAAYGTHGLLLNDGKIAAYGKITEVLRPEILDPVYRMDVAAWMRQMYGQWEAMP